MPLGISPIYLQFTDGRHRPAEPLTVPGSDLLGDVAEELFLFEGHLPSPLFGPLMLVAYQVQDAMDHQKDNHFHLI